MSMKNANNYFGKNQRVDERKRFKPKQAFGKNWLKTKHYKRVAFGQKAAVHSQPLASGGFF